MNAAYHVFRKETREMFRDKRVINGAFVMPIFLIALMMMLFGFLEGAVKGSKAPKIVVVDTAVARRETPELFPDAKVLWVADRKAGEKMLGDGKAQVVLEYAPDFEEKLADGGAQIDAVYDENETLSQIALGQMSAKVMVKNRERLQGVLKESGLPVTKSDSVLLVPATLGGKESKGPNPLVQLLPYLIVIWAFYGGFSTVSDMVAGEKERGTLETLLISPAHRNQIVLGKFFALALVCLISSMMSVVGLVLVRLLHLPGTATMVEHMGSIGPVQFLAIFIVLVTLVLFFSGLLLAISAAARNMREAQTYLTLVSFVVLMPAMFSQFIGFTDFGKELWIKFVPILDAAMCIREALQLKPNEHINWLGIGITCAVSLVLAAAMLQIVTKLFNRDQILTRV